MAVPKNRNWEAFENRQPPVDPDAVPLLVTGEVETNNGGIVPRLTPAASPGLNPTILILDLTLDNTGPGTTDINFRKAEYPTTVKQGQYAQVSIRWEGEEFTIFDVQVVV